MKRFLKKTSKHKLPPSATTIDGEKKINAVRAIRHSKNSGFKTGTRSKILQGTLDTWNRNPFILVTTEPEPVKNGGAGTTLVRLRYGSTQYGYGYGTGGQPRSLVVSQTFISKQKVKGQINSNLNDDVFLASRRLKALTRTEAV